ncbi:MAG: EAL domain-containing protein [Campylobacterota bacterium]|nr:EAL domain-containing protein [Campylobacterota bacterium]
MPIDIKNDTLEEAKQKLKARENSLRHLEAISNMGSWEVNLQTHQSVWSDQTYKIYELDKETTTPTLELFFSQIIPQDIPTLKLQLEEAIISGDVTSTTTKIKRADGTIATLLINGQVLKDENDKPVKLVGTTQDITEQVSLKRKTQELSTLIEHSSNEIYIVNFETLNYVYVNQGASNSVGYSVDDFLSMNVRDINPLLSEKKIDKLRRELSQTDYILNRTIHQRKDGTKYTVQSYIHKISYEGQTCFVIFDTDISNIVELEAQQRKQAKILDYIHDSVIATDTEGKITSWNRGSSLLFEYTDKEMIGHTIEKIYLKENNYKLEELFQTLQRQGSFEIEASMYKKNKTEIICDISLSVSRNEDGDIDGYIGYLQDITLQKQTESLLEAQTEKLKYLAHHDTLTNLPNRALFKDRLAQSIIRAKRNSEQFALLFIDLDQFKKINDSLGHHVGDEVLIQAAKRINSVLREEDSLARLGGDEFTVILNNIKNIQNISVVAQKIIDAMKEPITIAIHNLYVTSSIGISIYPDDAKNDLNLIKYADAAMYKAKDEGRNNYQFYSSSMTAYAFEHVVMESSLRVAIKEEEFVVYFQPQYDTKIEKLIGMEALVRWNHPSLGLIPPGKFIPIAEETGLIIEIDKLVMKNAMLQFSKWYKQGYNPGLLSLNLAMKQLNQDDFLEYIQNFMSSVNFKSEWLELEVTEGQVMNNPEASIEKLNSIHNMGIQIAIDDFGTGYSSLSYLKKLPLDKLKIDQSFIRDIPEDEDDMAITRAIIALGKSLNLKLIAEGVETQEQRDFLEATGCYYIQGYFYSRPILEDEIEELLKAN